MKIVSTILKWLFIAITVVVFVLPFIWMIALAFRPQNECLLNPPSLFSGIHYSFDAFPEFFKKLDFVTQFGNSVFVTLVITLASTFTSVLAGTAFAKYRFPGSNFVFMAFMATIMIPFFVVLVPMYMIINAFKLQNTYTAMILPFLASPFGIFYMRQTIYSVPTDLIYAARIDGCSEYGILFKMIVPSIGPALSSYGILTFMLQWDSMLWPMLISPKRQFTLITVGLANLSRENIGTGRWNLVMIGSLLITIPIVIAYLFMQRFFIQSMTMAGFKE